MSDKPWYAGAFPEAARDAVVPITPDPVVSEAEIEAGARAIAKAKRGPSVSDEVIGWVWRSYIGQSRACLTAALKVRTGK